MGRIDFKNITAVGRAEKAVSFRQNLDILITFETRHEVPESGSIEIIFHENVTHVQSHCRSLV